MRVKITRLLRIGAAGWALMLSGVPAGFANEFHEGNTQFGAGNYDSAARSYRLALDKGQVAAETYYNLGLAELKAGKLAGASLSFQRALALNPALEPARRELVALANQKGIEIPAATWVQRLAALVPAAWLWNGGAIAAWVGAFVLLGGLFAKTRRGVWLTFGALIFILGKVALGLAWTSDPLIQDRDLAVLTHEGANRFRSAPVENSETVTSLPGGSTVALISERGNWAYCAALDGKRGWIERDRLQRLMPEDS